MLPEVCSLLNLKAAGALLGTVGAVRGIVAPQMNLWTASITVNNWHRTSSAQNHLGSLEAKSRLMDRKTSMFWIRVSR